MSERRELPHDKDRVKGQLQGRVDGVLAACGFSRERERDGKLFPLNPRRKDNRPGSFVIWKDGAKGLYFRDFASGEEGDIYELIRWTLRLPEWIDAYWWSLNFLGLGRHEVRSASQIQQDREDEAAARKAAEAKRDAEAAAKAGKAKGFWLYECDPLWWLESPVWTYLTEARGLPMQRMEAAPGAIRMHPALDHFDKDTGEITTWPAMTTAISGPTGDVTGVHITWLNHGGHGKAPVEMAKKMRGVARGGAIRLTKGSSRLSPEDAARKKVATPLIITEGIEDGLTAGLARPSDRCWAAGSLSLLGELAWPACASSVVLVADNDWLKPAAISAFEKVEAKWRAMAEGRPLKVVRADVGKDLNDWARGVAA